MIRSLGCVRSRSGFVATSRRRTGRGLPEKITQGIPQAVAKLGVEAEPLGRRMQRAGAILVPVLGNLDRRGIGRAHRVRQVLAEAPAALVLDHPHLIVANSIDPELGQKEPRIIDEKLRYPIIPIGEDLTACPAVIGEEKAVVLVVRTLPVVKPDTELP